MAYCTVPEVETLMSLKFTSASKPTTAKVEELIADIEGEMDGVIEAAGYALPIGGTSALALLKRYNEYGVAAAVWHSGFITENDIPRVAYWHQEYKDFLMRMRKGDQFLPGAVTESGPGDPAFTIAGFANMEDING